MSGGPQARTSTDDDGLPALSHGRYDSFVLRVLHQEAGPGFIHGQVTHVSSRQSKRFTDLETAMGFISATLGRTATRPTVADIPP
jgi:hypothetical protein